MRFTTLALKVFGGLLFLPAVCFSQWVDQVRTESDWELLYNQGYFDYNTYQIYRELAEGISVNDSTDFFRAAMGNSLLESIGKADARELAKSDLDTSSRQALGLRVRTGNRVESSGKGSSYLFLSGARDDAAFVLKGRKGDGESKRSDWEIERRSLNWSRGQTNVTLGNYDTNIGLGLGIGRFDYRPISGISDTSHEQDDILYPDNSFYNGIKAEYRGGTAIFSAKRYPGLEKRIIGAAYAARFGDIAAGVSGAATYLDAGDHKRTMGAMSFYLIDPERGVRSEVAYAESGIGAALRVRRNGFDIAIWHYDRSYLNLQSSGIARPDYVRFEDSHFPEIFRQTQSGETGLYGQKGITLGRFDFGAATEIWKTSLNNGVSLDNLLLARYRIDDGIAVDTRLSSRSGPAGERTISEFGININRRLVARTKVSVWSEAGRSIDARSFCYIYGAINVKAGFFLAGRYRAYFDGDTDYFIEEALSVSDGIILKTTYRWQESYQGEIGPLYLVLEAVI